MNFELARTVSAAVPDPGFVLYPAQARICGGFPIPYSLTPENKYQPDVDEIHDHVVRVMQEIMERRFRWNMRQVLTTIQETRAVGESTTPEQVDRVVAAVRGLRPRRACAGRRR